MNLTKTVLGLVLIAPTPGCRSATPGVGEAFIKPTDVRAKDEANRRGYGFRPGTDAFANCLMQQNRERSTNKWRGWQALQAADQQPAYEVRAPEIKPMPHMCTQFACY